MKQSGRQLKPWHRRSLWLRRRNAASGARVGGVMGAVARHNFDASFPSIKVGIIILAWSIVLQAAIGPIWPISYHDPTAIIVLLFVLHFALLFAASAWVWSLVWKELHDKGFRECVTSASFHIHVLATSLAPLLAESFKLNPAFAT